MTNLRDKAAILQTFSERLKGARETAELSQIEASSALGISRTKYQSMERGEIFPRFDEIIDLAKLFQRSEVYFFPSLVLLATDNIYTQRLDEIRSKYDDIETRLDQVESSQANILTMLNKIWEKVESKG
ncbi:helix-turn-helix domain-containing protein [Vibrio atypicus]|uniref:helix-turn-helix domain-containing protein n=1 Tax=Vibrio atypicus TaxID=558271 RepID=UPI00135B3D7B|nr:helix-turn-helix transcriptional regulator [Vibrio atypicus]